MLQSLDDVPAEAWRRLAQRNGAWRTPVLASRNGLGADARVVVLRRADAATRALTFFTDRRSRKCEQLRAGARACFVIYDAVSRWQLRLYGTAREESNVAQLDTYWKELSTPQRAHYANEAAERSVNEKGRENFAAFVVLIDAMHCLWIHDTGNTAAEFYWQDGNWRGHPARP